ncbi:MAG: hypothetical protein K5872_04670 [Rhizobiaceae bacterium]|nr:hypothetical protein [Rhizobiaceae bacterium]MCV0405503.1 hypothetical protein [Rhizobiaceae bacterium]
MPSAERPKTFLTYKDLTLLRRVLDDWGAGHGGGTADHPVAQQEAAARYLIRSFERGMVSEASLRAGLAGADLRILPEETTPSIYRRPPIRNVARDEVADDPKRSA